MKNINDKTKKWLIITGGIVISIALIVIIGVRFQKPPVKDVNISSQNSEVQDVVTKTPDTSEKEDEIKVPTVDVPQKTETDNGAVDTGTEQKIQRDAEKPTYTEEQLTNPNKKPNGDKVTVDDKPVEHDKVEKPTAPTQKTSGGLPGFDNVPNGGENHGEYVDGDGDINKQVGNMGQ
ncbi:DUF6550 family protein [Anaerovorax sp. IOR16]|uniref:DUF6550 family protein n=1 Tax=Anaerovorax sp. IOR16 TaxID=2773458 RepID=UPI0019D15BDF|nr:DUF6550 family protein [Anaerovorax sp. IOR16]